jgi:hypothetical protein
MFYRGSEEEEAQLTGEIRCGSRKTMTLCGLAGKVGVTGRDVGCVGEVIPGKGNCVPPVRETPGYKVQVTVFPGCPAPVFGFC